MAVKSREHVLAELVRKNGYRTMVEVGVKNGRVFGHILKHCPNVMVWGIDAWHKRESDGTLGSESYVAWDMDAMEANVHKIARQYVGRAVVIKGDSAGSARMFFDNSADIVFIDADHSEAGVKRDIAAWLPKVRKGGILCGHDILWPSVKAAVEGVFGDTYEVLPDEIWLVYA
jgi:hypothetical protein